MAASSRSEHALTEPRLLGVRVGHHAVSAPLAVAALTLVAVIVRVLLARQIPTPWMLDDEIKYS